MKASTAERLRDKGQKALNQPSLFIPMMIIVTLIPFLFWIGIIVSDISNGKTIIASVGNTTTTSFFFIGLVSFLITVLNYERRNYYKIIQTQERKIRELETQLTT
jgi:hypothetical protein